MINCKTSRQMIYVAIPRATMTSKQPIHTHKMHAYKTLFGQSRSNVHILT